MTVLFLFSVANFIKEMMLHLSSSASPEWSALSSKINARKRFAWQIGGLFFPVNPAKLLM